MSAIDHYLRYVKRIPERVLNRAFPVTCQWDARSIEERIVEEVIYEMVIPDMNVTGGELAYLGLEHAVTTAIGDKALAYHFKNSVLEGRYINAVHGAYLRKGSHASSNPINSPGGVEDSILPVLNVLVRKTGRNTINISQEDMTYTDRYDYVKVSLSHDKNLNDIPDRAWITFAKLGLHATKAKIYTKLYLDVSDGELRGANLSTGLTSLVDKYEDAYDDYDEMLNQVWRKVNYMSDRRRHNNFIRSQLPISL